MMSWTTPKGWLPVLAAGVFCLHLMACTAAAPDTAAEVLPTPTILTASFDQATSVIDVEAAHEAQAQATLTAASTENIALGERIYGNLCAQCHGDSLQGTDQGSALTDFALTAADLEVLLRTGGGLGNQHLFGTSKVSSTGISALFQYLEAAARPE